MAKRVTSIGGQALLEGILMVGPKKNVAAFCDEAGNITTEEVSTPSLREKYPILKKPFIRGVFSMVDTLRLGMKALTLSADKVGGEEEEEPSKFEKWLEKKFGDKVMNAVVAVGGVLGVALAEPFLTVICCCLPFCWCRVFWISEHTAGRNRPGCVTS